MRLLYPANLHPVACVGDACRPLVCKNRNVGVWILSGIFQPQGSLCAANNQQLECSFAPAAGENASRWGVIKNF